MLVPSAKAGGIFALYRKNRIVMTIFTKWRKSANLFLQIGGLPLYTAERYSDIITITNGV